MHPHICPSCGCSLTRFEPFSFGNVAIDDCRRIRLEGRAVKLPRSQCDIVEALVRARGRGLTRAVLANLIEGDVNDSTIVKYIERARAKLREVDPGFDQIAALRGFGAYRWRYRPARRERSAAAARISQTPTRPIRLVAHAL